MTYLAISPYFAVLPSLFAMFMAFLYPNEAWQEILFETNYGYLNFDMVAFVLVNLVFLYGGVYLAQSITFKTPMQSPNKDNTATVLLIAPVLLVTLVVLLSYVGYLIVHHHGFIFYAFEGKGTLVKEMIQTDEVDFSTLVNFAVPVVWWGWYRTLQVKQSIPFLLLIRSLLLLATIALVFVMIVLVSRFALMPLIIGIFVIVTKFLVFDKRPKTQHLKLSIILFAFLAVVIVVLFIFFSIARGYDDTDALWEMILGYGAVSFNRLSCLLQGGLSFEYSHTGFYLLPEPLFSLYEFFAHETPLSGFEVWLSEFDGAWEAGLNENFIWLTQFGYVYDSIGIATPLFFLLYGIMTGVTWRGFLASKSFGIIFYPLLYFSIFFLFGSIYFVIYFFYYFFVFIMLSMWEYIMINLFLTSDKKEE